MSLQEIVCAHSPDSDDAFMFYALATRKVRSRTLSFRHVLEDIESLNKKATEGQYELTAISYHAYPYVAHKYVLLSSGSSVGDGYGPVVVSTKSLGPDELAGKRIAIPGTMTTAFLALKLFQPDFEHVIYPFDKILEAVKESRGRCRSDHSRRAVNLRPWRPPQRARSWQMVSRNIRSATAARRQRVAPQSRARCSG